MMNMHVRTIVSVAFAALIAGCSGGGGGSPAPSLPVSAPAQSKPQNVTLTINIPGRTSSSSKRRPLYVGAGTQSAQITVTPGAGVQGTASTTTVNCTTTCQATLSVFPGSNTFAVNLYDGTNGSGNLLSSGSMTQTIVAGSNTVNLTFNGVVYAVAVVANPPSLVNGTSGSTTLTIDGLDADGNTIVGPGVYTQPVTLASSWAHITLSATSVTAPGQTVTANYDGTSDGWACDDPVAINASSPTIKAVPPSVGGVIIAASSSGPTPCGLTLSTPQVTVTSGGGTATVTLTDYEQSGPFTGSFTITNNCAGPGYATISPSTANGPSATFTITGQTSSGGLPCAIQFSDGTNATTLTVSVM